MLNNFILQSVDKHDFLHKSLPEPKGDKWENPHRLNLLAPSSDYSAASKRISCIKGREVDGWKG